MVVRNPNRYYNFLFRPSLHFKRMSEPAYTEASDSETTGEEKSSPPSPEVAIGIDIGMSEPAYTVASDSETTGEEKSSPPSPEVAIGIDIGTSQSSVAIWNGSDVELLGNRREQKLFRSYVKFKDDEIPVTGISSQLSDEYEMLSGAAIFNMKRLVGRIDTDSIVHASKSLPFLVQTLDIGVRPFVSALVNNVWRSMTPEEVLAIFLLELKTMAEIHLKRPVRNAVLTIPVSFTRFQLSRVERACAMVGLQVLRLMPEPTAVALFYAQQQQNAPENTGSGSEKVALIFNMGAGFCDVAITATAGGVTQIKAMRGSTLGGEDMLLNMMHHLLPDMNILFASHGIDEIRKLGLLRVATQEAIHKLSSQSSIQIDLELGNGRKICRSIDREEFEEVNKGVFAECERLIMLCLLEAKVEQIEDINDVILVGGCSNIPKLQNIVKGICERDFYTGSHPLEAAVRGAALEGALASGFNDPFGSLDLLTIQVTPRSIGIKAYGNNYVPIILQNTTIPARKELVFTTIHDNQNEALLVVFEGNENTVKKNHLVGYFKTPGIPLAPKGVPKISVCMDINASNVLRVFVGVIMPGEQNPATPFMEVLMPTVDGGHGLCAEALGRTYGDSFDLVVVQKKVGC